MLEPSRRGGERWTICGKCGNRLHPQGRGFTHAPYQACGRAWYPVEVVEAASYDQLQQELEEARRERDRYRRNWRQSMDFTAVEQDAYDAADLRAEAAEAQLQTASERIERLERALGDVLKFAWPTIPARYAAGSRADHLIAALNRASAALATPAEEEGGS